MPRLRLMLPLAVAALSALGLAQSPGSRASVGTSAFDRAPKPTTRGPVAGARGVRETVGGIMARPQERGRDIEKDDSDRYPDLSGLPMDPGSLPVSSYPGGRVSEGAAPAPLAKGGRLIGPRFANSTGWLATDQSESPYRPPDTQADVSPTQVLVAVNGKVKLFDRGGNLGALNTSTDAFFASVRSAGVSDPRVRYDRLSDRWFVVAIDVKSSDNRILVAVSNSGTISATSSFTFFQFAQSTGGAPAASFADYPTLGIDRSALYIGTNQFGSTTGGFQGSDGFVVRKSSLLAGGPVVVTHFRGLGTSATGGLYTPQGVDNDDPASTEGYFAGVDLAAAGRLRIARISDPGGTPAADTSAFVTVPTTAVPPDVPQAGTSALMDSLDTRLFLAKIQYDAVTGRRTLWTAHNIGTDAGGVAASSGATRASSRWYQIGGYATGSTPSLVQAGTVFGAEGTNPTSYWIPSVVQNLQGNALLGSSYGNAGIAAGASWTARTAGDALGTMSAPTVATTGSGAYTGTRWGDYSMASVDPTDGMTFWTWQCYSNAGRWAVWTQKVLSNPPVAGAFAPGFLRRGQSAGAALSGTGFFDPPASYPNHLALSVPGTAVSGLAFVSPTGVTANLAVAANAPLGARSATLTNPDGQTTTAPFEVRAPLFTGSVTLRDLYPSAARPPIAVEFLDASGAVVLTTTATPDASGTILLEPDVPAGVYTVRLRAAHFLRRAVAGVDASGGTATFSASLINGDVNGDNVVTIADVNAFRDAFGSSVGDARYNPNADLNGDGVVTIADLNILRGSLGLTGD